MEEWKEIEINGLLYMVSNYGNVVGCSSGAKLKQRLNADGYKCITVGKMKSRSTKRVHRLVAMLFVDNPNNEDEVNHIDFNRQNNHYTNLEWVNHLDNIKHSYEHGRYSTRDIKGDKNPNYGNDTLKIKYRDNPELAKINNSRKGTQNGRCVPVSIHKLNGELIKTFNYIGECALYLINSNISNGKIDSIRDRISRSAKTGKPYLGFMFKIDNK